MKAILSADLNWGIGYKGNLLQHVPEDMKYFKNTTIGKVVVMGRETFQSLPGMQPLKDRVNIILSASGQFEDERLMICRSLKDLAEELQKYREEDVFIIGGESVYRQLLPYCSEVFVTRFEKEYEADRHFPDLDTVPGWKLISESGRHFYGDLGFFFRKYANEQVKEFMPE